MPRRLVAPFVLARARNPTAPVRPPNSTARAIEAANDACPCSFAQHDTTMHESHDRNQRSSTGSKRSVDQVELLTIKHTTLPTREDTTMQNITRAALPIFIALSIGSGCGSDSKSEADKGPIESPFEVTVNKSEIFDEVAPNETWLKNGLSEKASDGKTFVCVQYEVTSKGGAKARTVGREGRLQVKVSALPIARVVDPEGNEAELHGEAAAKYQPDDWKSERAEFEAGKPQKRNGCFEVDKDKTKDLKLVFADDIDGRPWKVETALPATT